jgi:TPR repeat protein
MNARRAAVWLALGSVAVAGAAERPAAKADGDNALPQLVSRTGGGGPRWTSIADVKRDAEKGVPAACLELAGCYESGRDVPKDIVKALALYQQAATGGEANGWFRLGKIYADGLGVEPDLPKALGYYRQGARAGVVEAQYNVGAMLVSARGVKRDWVEGLAWLIVATKHGAPPAGEQQVRAQLAKRPGDIAAAELRAEEILNQSSPSQPALEPHPVPRDKLPSPQPTPPKVSIPPALPPVQIKITPPQLPSPPPLPPPQP